MAVIGGYSLGITASWISPKTLPIKGEHIDHDDVRSTVQILYCSMFSSYG